MRELLDCDVRRYIAINTTEYNDDGKFTAALVSYDELAPAGVEIKDTFLVNRSQTWIRIDEMNVGDVVEIQRGSHLMRVA